MLTLWFYLVFRKNVNMKKIFITGGRGFIGTRLCMDLMNFGHDVHVFDIADTLLNDVRDYKAVYDAIHLYEPTHIIHLGMTSKVKDGNISPRYTKDSILGGTMNILEAVKNYDKLERLVFASSSTVYGDFIPELSPPNEDHPKNPINVYGSLKLCSEVLIKSYHEMFGIDYTIIRPSSVYGPNDENMRVIGKFIFNALNGIPMRVHGENMEMDFSFIDDVADGFIRATLSKNGKNETFNITRGQTRTLLEAAEIIQSLIPGSKIEILDSNALFPKRGAFDVSKAKELLDYNPKIDLPDGIKTYCEVMVRDNSW